MKVFQVTSQGRLILPVALLAIVCLGCDATSRSGENKALPPAVPSPPANEATTESPRPEATVVVAGEAPWIARNELPWERWYLQYVDGQRVGYSQVVVDKSAIESDQERIRITRVDCIEIDNEGEKTRFKRTIESLEYADGRLIQLSDRSTALQNSAQIDGKRVQGKFSAVSVQTTPENKERSNIAFAWPDEAWGVMGLQAVMMRQMPKTGQLLQAQVFVPQLYKIAQASLLAGQLDLTALPGGQTKSLLAVDVLLQSEDSSIRSRNWINDRGEVLKTVALTGPNLSTFLAPTDVAHRTRDEFELADLLSSRVSLTGALPGPEARQVVYAIDRGSADKGTEVYSMLAKSATQSVVSLNALSAEATVTMPLDQQAADSGQLELAPAEEFLQASDLVPAENPRLIALAEQWGRPQGDEVQDSAAQSSKQPTGESATAHSPQAVAMRLAGRVKQEIAVHPLDRTVNGPLPTMREKSGDCVEHAILLTGLLRAAKIPARVAGGLMVDKQAADQMQFHLWVEAWLGDRWLALDSTTGTIAGPDRLKFYDSSLSNDNPYDAILPAFVQMQGLQVRIKSIE